jgi:hypothetical protein
MTREKRPKSLSCKSSLVCKHAKSLLYRLYACYDRAVNATQIKELSAPPNTGEWLERLRQDPPVTGISSEEIVITIHDERAERDEQIGRAHSAGD